MYPKMKPTLVAFLFIVLGVSCGAQATFVVTTIEDNGDNMNPTPGSLRAAINAVNESTSTNNSISFKITTGTAPFIIQPPTDLPTISNTVLIDGYTQPGSKVNSLPEGNNAILQIVINGSNYTVGDGNVTGNGLHFTTGSDGSVVRGLVINQWLENGILIDSVNGPVTGISVKGCFIGTDVSGMQEMANRTGIGFHGAQNTVIGTSDPADRNVIAGSFGFLVTDSYGIRGGSICSVRTRGTVIQNNYIGTDKSGTIALGNSLMGLSSFVDTGILVGGGALERNIISGSAIYGLIFISTNGATIQGNYIGTDVTGTQSLGNANAGIELERGSSGNSILKNLISGNGTGIRIGQNEYSPPTAMLNIVQGNYIGTDASGGKTLQNTRYGIEINNNQNTIGGTEAGQENVISGNGMGGILIYSTPNATGNLVLNNYIGTDRTGTIPLANQGNGIQLGLNGGLGGTSDNSIGELGSTSIVGLQQEVDALTESGRGLKKRGKRIDGTDSRKDSAHSTKVASMPKVNQSMKRLLSQPSQTIGLNFTAATVSDAIGFNYNGGAANPSGWVGPQQYILMSYAIIRSFDKATGRPDGVLNIDGPSFLGASIGDPRITYSRFLNRWILSAENQDIGYPSELIIAWSDSGVITPETVWTIITLTNEQLVPQNIPADGHALLDYQQLATDVNAVYISLDTFDTTTKNYLGTSTVVIPNSSITTGNTSPAFTVIPGILETISEFTPPADNFDPDATFGYLINAPGFEYPCLSNIVPFCPPPFTPTECCTYNQLFFYRILNPGSSQPTLGQLIVLDVPDYADPANAPFKGNLYTTLELPPGNVNAMYLQTTASKLNAPHVRNKQLYVCHNIQVDYTGTGNPGGDRVGVRWYQFDLTGDPTGNGCGIETETTCPALVQWGTVYDPEITDTPKFYYIPAIMTNKNGDLVIEGTVSGSNDYINVFYAGRKATDPLGTLRDPVLLTDNTTNSFNFGPLNNYGNGNIGQRWGDLSSLAPDPSNDLAIWSTGMWAAIPNSYGFQATQLLPTKQ